MGRRRKKKPPCRVTFTRYEESWCITGPAEDMREGDLIQVKKKSGQREWVRVEKILARRPGDTVIASFRNKENAWDGHWVQNPKRRGRSR